MTGCDRFGRDIVLLLERDGALDEHVTSCAPCQEAYRAYVSLVAALPSARQPVKPPAGWRSRVLATVHGHDSPGANKARGRGIWGVVRVASLGAALALALVFVGRGLLVPTSEHAEAAPAIQIKPDELMDRVHQPHGSVGPGAATAFPAAGGSASAGPPDAAVPASEPARTPELSRMPEPARSVDAPHPRTEPPRNPCAGLRFLARRRCEALRASGRAPAADGQRRKLEAAPDPCADLEGFLRVNCMRNSADPSTPERSTDSPRARTEAAPGPCANLKGDLRANCLKNSADPVAPGLSTDVQHPRTEAPPDPCASLKFLTWLRCKLGGK